MADDVIATDHDPVILIDRAMTGGFEIIFDARRHVFPKGEIEIIGYVDLVKHIFRNEKARVWTKPAPCRAHKDTGANLRECLDCKPGEYVCRIAIKDAPGFKGSAERLAAAVGEEALDASPLDIDTNVIEGWSLEGRTGTVLVVPTGSTSADFRERQGQTRHPGALVVR